MANERLQEAVDRIVLIPVRLRHSARAKERRAARAEAIEAVRRALERAVGRGAQELGTLFNVGLYLLLLDADLAEYLDDYISAPNDRRRRFVAKHAALLLYEASTDLCHLLGGKFRATAVTIGASSELMARIGAITSTLSTFSKRHGESLKKVRNVLTAHRVHDALTYLRLSDALDPMGVMEMGAEISLQLEKLAAVFTELTALERGARGQGRGASAPTAGPESSRRPTVRGNAASRDHSR